MKKLEEEEDFEFISNLRGNNVNCPLITEYILRRAARFYNRKSSAAEKKIILNNL